MESIVLIVLGASMVVNVVLACVMVIAKSGKNQAKVGRAFPPRSSLSLNERMADLGLEFKHYPAVTHIPEDIRRAFGVTEDGEAICKRCHCPVEGARSNNPAISPCHLGFFCPNCGEGRLFLSVETARKANRLPSLPNENLFAIMAVLERFALKNGLIRESAAERPHLEIFDATLQETADYRSSPLKVRVDIEARTVTLVDETANSGQSLRLVK